MGVLAKIVAQCQPAAYGSGVPGAGTAGVSWNWAWKPTTAPDGTVVDLSGVTGNCVVTDGVGGGPVATLTFTGASDGTFTIALPPTSTAGLAGGATTQPRQCVWHFTLSDGTDTVQVWGPANSPFLIYPGV